MKKAKTKTLYITTEQSGFDTLTRNISRNTFLSDGAKCLYIYLNSHSESFNFSIESIANYLHKSIRTINREIEELKKSGFLILERKPNSKTYYYKLLNSPKLEHLKDITPDLILKACIENVISLQDINELRKKKIITLEQYNEITDNIIKILKTEWLTKD